MTPEITIFRRNYESYTVNFFGTPIDVTVTASASVARRWLNTTLFLRRSFYGRLVVGLGVQWNPRNNDGADTLQICVGTRCLIFQLSLAQSVPHLLRRLLLDPKNTFIGFWNGRNENMLWLSRHELRVHRLLDLRRYAVDGDGDSLARASVEVTVGEYLGHDGVRLDRDISVSDWGEEDLSNEQILHACVDAHVAFETGKNMRAWQF